MLATSYSKKAKIRVQMAGNTIGRNARLGVLIDGPGSSVRVSDTRFEAGNGYGGLIPEKQAEPCDLLAQGGATVSGTDEKRVETVTGVFVMQDAPNAENGD